MVAAAALGLDAIRDRGHQRDQRQRDGQRCHQGDRHGDGLVLEQLRRDAFDEDDRREDDDRRQNRRDDGHLHFRCAVARRFDAALASFAALLNGLQHDDGAVDEHSYTEREPSQGHHVQRGAELVHQEERGDDRDRDRDRDDERAAQVLEESSSTRMAMMPPCTAALITSSIDASMKRDWSVPATTSSPSGISFTRSSRSRTERATDTVLASPSL